VDSRIPARGEGEDVKQVARLRNKSFMLAIAISLTLAYIVLVVNYSVYLL